MGHDSRSLVSMAAIRLGQILFKTQAGQVARCFGLAILTRIGLSSAARRHLISVFRFGVIGTIAVLSQAFSVFVLANYADFSGFASSAVGHAVSLVISYPGQNRWTFTDRKDRSIPKILMVVVVSFILASQRMADH